MKIRDDSVQYDLVGTEIYSEKQGE